MEKSVLGIADPFDAIERLAVAYVEFGLERPEHYRVLFMGHKADKEAEIVDGRLTGAAIEGSRSLNLLMGMVDRLLADAGRRGRRDLPDPLILTVELWALVHGLTALRISFPTMPWPDTDATVADAVDGLRVRFAPRSAR
jgi:hypothetical protein